MEPSQNQPITVLEELEKVILQGDEATAREFINKHINEFPEEVKQGLAARAVLEAGARDMANTEIKRRGLIELLKEMKEAIQGASQKN